MADHILHFDLFQEDLHIPFQDHQVMHRIPILIVDIVIPEDSDQVRRIDQVLLEQVISDDLMALPMISWFSYMNAVSMAR